ncbi:MAG: CinA family protein [Firmicutes bacterium]|nr:CinA family protein [Bacillota bacterium]
MPLLYGITPQTISKLLPEAEVIVDPAGVRLKLPNDKNQLRSWWRTLYPHWQMGDADNFTLVRYLLKHKLSLATVESCTGGLIASLITDVPGASAIFSAGLCTYSAAAKVEYLRLNPADIPAGAVSQDLTINMAVRVRQRSRTSLGLATTGVLGPQSPAPGLNPGLVYIALSSNEHQVCRRFNFTGNRETIKQLAARAALNFLFTFSVRWTQWQN